MSIIRQSTPWTRQPQTPVGVQSPLANVGSVFVGSSRVDPHTRKLWLISNGASEGVASFGRAFSPGASAGGIQQSGLTTAAQTKCTFIGVFRINSAKQFSFLARSSATNTSFSIGNGSGANGGLSYGIHKAGVTTLNEVVLTAGVVYSFVASHDQATGEYYFLARNAKDGSVLRAAGTSVTASLASTGTAYIGVNVSPNDFDGAVGLVYQAFNFLPENRASSFLNNPWQVFAPQTLTVWAVDAGGSEGASGLLLATDSPDSASATGQVRATGAAAAIDAPDTDTANATAQAPARAVAAATDTPDTCVATGGQAFTYVPALLQFTSPARGQAFNSPSRTQSFTSPSRTQSFTSPSRA